jgi:flagellar motor protein MotB
VWAVFGDLMAGLLGAFVLILVGVLGVQMDLATKLEAEINKRQVEESRRIALEQALAGPLASGRVTLHNGRIGISGSVLFATNSAALQPEGRQLLNSLVSPLRAYLSAREAIVGGKDRYEDNWELSAQRALTVTRTLVEEGMPSSTVFAAAFGAGQPVASNADAQGRSQNRRVEMAPVPKSGNTPASAAP